MLTRDTGLKPAAAKCTGVTAVTDHRSPGDVVVSHHAVQDGGKSAGRGGGEGLRVIRAKVVGVAEFSVHVRICCKNRCKGNRGKIYKGMYGKVKGSMNSPDGVKSSEQS